MSLKIRLARGGTKKRPHYRIVIADSRSPRDGRFIERVGTYDPMLPKEHPGRVNIKEDRIRHWLSVGAKPSDRVGRFLSLVDIVDKAVIPEQTKKNMPKAKAQERAKKAAEVDTAAGSDHASDTPIEATSVAADVATPKSEVAPTDDTQPDTPIAEVSEVGSPEAKSLEEDAVGEAKPVEDANAEDASVAGVELPEDAMPEDEDRVKSVEPTSPEEHLGEAEAVDDPNKNDKADTETESDEK